MTEWHFLRPFWLLALLPLAWLIWRMAKPAFSRSNWNLVCDPHLLPYILHQPKHPTATFTPWFVAVPGVLLILAMAGPVWQQRPQPIFYTHSALVLLLDLSHSMDATDLKPSRLTRAKHKVMDVLRQRREGQTALLVFAKDPFVVTPLTHDTATISALLSDLDTALMPAQGSRPDRAVKKAAELLRQGDIDHGNMLLMTDEWLGNDQVVRNITSEGHTLAILGVGTEEGAPIPLVDGGFLRNADGSIVMAKLNKKHLQHLARLGGGGYQSIRADNQDIKTLLTTQKHATVTASTGKIEIMTDTWHEEGPWIVLAVLPLAAFAMRKGILMVLMVLLLSLSNPGRGHALDWENLWQRPDQRAMQQLNAGHLKQSADLFKNKAWKAVAHYRAGQFQQAIANLQGNPSLQALYNKGNALAQLGLLEAAAQAFIEVLKHQPDHVDARYNLEQIKKRIQPSGEHPTKMGSFEAPSSSSQSSRQSSSQSSRQNLKKNKKGGAARNTSQGRLEKSDQRQTSAKQTNKTEGTDKKPGKVQEALHGKHASNPPQQDGVDASRGQAQEVEQRAWYKESQLATEQWLRRVPDDPGGLLRRKFRYQYQLKRLREKSFMTTQEEHPW